MNAIISLCHFCEVHGPQVLFCTQPLHPLERSTSTDSDDTTTAGRKGRSSSITNEPTTPTSAKNDFCGVQKIFDYKNNFKLILIHSMSILFKKNFPFLMKIKV